jgi:hypothetical protein
MMRTTNQHGMLQGNRSVRWGWRRSTMHHPSPCRPPAGVGLMKQARKQLLVLWDILLSARLSLCSVQLEIWHVLQQVAPGSGGGSLGHQTTTKQTQPAVYQDHKKPWHTCIQSATYLSAHMVAMPQVAALQIDFNLKVAVWGASAPGMAEQQPVRTARTAPKIQPSG